MTDNYSNFFPYNEIRDQQREAIEFCLRSMTEGKRFIVVEAGTGVGKSAIGLTIARAHTANSVPGEDPITGTTSEPGAWFITTQKILQDQYTRDFHKIGLRSIKSSSNYQCKYKKHNTCSDSHKELKVEEKGSKFWNACNIGCIYRAEKQDFLKSQSSVTNFPYLLTEANYSGKITRRQLLVIDEAHNTEGELSKFIEVVVSERFCTTVLKVDFFKPKSQHQAHTWIKETYLPKVESHVKHVEAMLEKYTGIKDKLNDFIALSRQIDLLKGHKEKLRKFIDVYDADNWVYELIEADGKSMCKISFKPIDVAPFAESMLFRLGEKVLLMSATILDKDAFCQSLGIKPEEAAFISLPSPFPVENRPIFFFPVGSMTQGGIDSSLPKLVEAIRSFMEEHKGQKGIIHTHSYKIASYIKKHIKSKRLLMHDSHDRDDVLAKHISSKDPTILLSPSMSEGVDLKQDASRFQVVCKVPYPYLGDKLVSKRMHKWAWWYPLQTAKTIVQSVGRSIRSVDDHAVTYILDSNWESFYRKNKHMFPPDFDSCLRRG